MPKHKSHRGLLKRIKLTKSGKVRFKAPNGRHLKSNKTGTAVQSYRKSRYARTGDLRYLKKLLCRPLRSEEQHVADDLARASAGTKPARRTTEANAKNPGRSKSVPAAKGTAKTPAAAKA
jgi:large subunit ribosomal protein L35